MLPRSCCCCCCCCSFWQRFSTFRRKPLNVPSEFRCYQGAVVVVVVVAVLVHNLSSTFTSQVAAAGSQLARVAHDPTSQVPAWTPKAILRNPSKRENSQPSLLNSNEKFTFWQRFSTFRRKPLNVPSEFRCYQGAVVVVVVAVHFGNVFPPSEENR